jgi:acetyltransferase-like isoleucine patch superfamily enzyme
MYMTLPLGKRTTQSGGRQLDIAYIVRRTREVGVVNLLLGLNLRRSFTKAGILAVHPGFPLPRVTNKGGRIEAGNCSFYPGVHLECWKNATIRIGTGTYINRNTEIVASQAVTIGANCMIARDVLIMDTDQHPVRGQALISKPVEIGDRVWLGSRSIILKGVSIGHDSIVGAGAIVTKSVPPDSVVVGPAARVIRNLRDQPTQ